MRFHQSYFSIKDSATRKANKEKYSELSYAVALIVIMAGFFIGGLAL